MRNDELYHSAEGKKWKHHKYLRIENGRYIYPPQAPTSAKKAIQKQMIKDRVKGSDYTPQADAKLRDDPYNKPGAFESSLDKKYKYIAKIKLSNGNFRYFYNQDELKSYYMKNGTEAEKAFVKEYGLKDYSCKSESDQTEINGMYLSEENEYRHNCVMCSLAFDMRRKGFDVEANPSSKGISERFIYGCYEDFDKDNVTRIIPRKMDYRVAGTKMINDLKANGDGAYGIAIVTWKSGGGHAINWEVRNGKVILRDSQNSNFYNESEISNMLSYTDLNSPSFAAKYVYTNTGLIYFRTDNLKFNKKVMKYVQKNKRSDKYEFYYAENTKVDPYN